MWLRQIVHLHRNSCLSTFRNLHLLLAGIDDNLIVVVGEKLTSLSTTLHNVILDAINEVIFPRILSKANASLLSIFALNDFQDFEIAHVAILVVREYEDQ